MNPNYRHYALWVVIFFLAVALFVLFQKPGQSEASSQMIYSQFSSELSQGHVRDVVIAGHELSGHLNSGTAFTTYAPTDPGLVDKLLAKGVSTKAEHPNSGSSWLAALIMNGLPLIAMIGILVFMSRQMQGGAGKAMGFGKSKAKLLTEAHGRVAFSDVAGVDEAKEDLEEIVEFL